MKLCNLFFIFMLLQANFLINAMREGARYKGAGDLPFFKLSNPDSLEELCGTDKHELLQQMFERKHFPDDLDKGDFLDTCIRCKSCNCAEILLNNGAVVEGRHLEAVERMEDNDELKKLITSRYEPNRIPDKKKYRVVTVFCGNDQNAVQRKHSPADDTGEL